MFQKDLKLSYHIKFMVLLKGLFGNFWDYFEQFYQEKFGGATYDLFWVRFDKFLGNFLIGLNNIINHLQLLYIEGGSLFDQCLKNKYFGPKKSKKFIVSQKSLDFKKVCYKLLSGFFLEICFFELSAHSENFLKFSEKKLTVY